MTTQDDEPAADTQEAAADGQRPAHLLAGLRQTWMTTFILLVNFGIFLGIRNAGELNWENLSGWGLLRGEAILDGQWWALLSSAAVHMALWHLAFNMYWLYVFGPPMERLLGPLRYLALLVCAAWFSSVMQLTIEGSSGHGFSGVIYAMFGFMWPLRAQVPAFRSVVTPGVIGLFVIWFFVCIVLTYTGVLNVANAAHGGGMLCGLFCGWLLRSRARAVTIYASLALFAAFCVVPLLWAPWSTPWIAVQAERAFQAERYQEAIAYYDSLLARDPGAAWARFNRGLAYREMGEHEQAERDFRRAREPEGGDAGP